METTLSETRCTCGAGHATFGACMRDKGFRVGYCQSANQHDYTRARKWEHELATYADAVGQGIQPAGTLLHQTRAALDISDKTGAAFNAGA